MRRSLLTQCLLASLSATGQEDLKSVTDPIVQEGKRLYRSEMASWLGTDLFLEKCNDRNAVGGNFSYQDGKTVKCIFFSNTQPAGVIGTISFDTVFSPGSGRVDLTERRFSPAEAEYFSLRMLAAEIIRTDTLFKHYNKTSLSLIPVIDGGKKRVYVLTAPKEPGLIIIGNDYLLEFDQENRLTSRRALHRNILAYETESEDRKTAGTQHTHLPETGDFITPTDICTMMLYGRHTKWKQHSVVSENYLSVWDIENNELSVIPMEIVRKMNSKKKSKNAPAPSP